VRETYVRPPLLGREPRSRTLTVWPLRVLVLILLAALVWGFILLLRFLLKPQDEGGGIGALRATQVSSQRHR
jgi:hypothetical protein